MSRSVITCELKDLDGAARLMPAMRCRTAPERRKGCCVAACECADKKRGQKKPGRTLPRSNNDKRRMVTRRQHQSRTVKTDYAARKKFENFFELLQAASNALSGGARRAILRVGRIYCAACGARR
ncbi:hypothetical protein GNZ24_01675 [Burkholderia thailandensis]|nr:hypothetical protein [Burkholderia thailandensis]NBC92851.1 hypothetical protein [Burkholderia thailandensis]NBD04278.1 hypothetical protein [Burkholderia thailandensis]NBJ20848.1 hypothetical protein [Burkholderia thailandensis]NOK42936.1 hypothetical protein [Burkholderia thailandensis]